MGADFVAAYEFAGTGFMRQKMSHILCFLELVYYQIKIGRQFTEDERLERYTNWDIGLNMDTLNLKTPSKWEIVALSLGAKKLDGADINDMDGRGAGGQIHFRPTWAPRGGKTNMFFIVVCTILKLFIRFL